MVKKRSFGLAIAFVAIALAVPASVLGYTAPAWNLNGNYTIPFVELTGGDGPGPYPYSVTIDVTSDTTGEVSGTGYYITGGGYPAVTITGQVTGWDVSLDFEYTDPTLASYNPFELVGKIDSNGAMAGTANDGHGRTFSWSTTSGSVSIFSPRCDYGTYAGYTEVWHGFAPADGTPTVTTALQPGYDYFVESSGTYFAGGNGLFDIQADAEYSQDAAQRAADAPWQDGVNGYAGEGLNLLDLEVDGEFVEWGAYNAGHRYTLDVTPTGSPLTIGTDIYDTYYPNNTGGLCVAVYQKLPGHFTGFYRPIDMNGVVNTVKAGSVVPVKFNLYDGAGNLVTDPALITLQSKSIDCDAIAGDATDGIETTAPGATALRWDATAQQFVANWKIPKMPVGACYALTASADEATSITAYFQAK